MCLCIGKGSVLTNTNILNFKHSIKSEGVQKFVAEKQSYTFIFAPPFPRKKAKTFISHIWNFQKKIVQFL